MAHKTSQEVRANKTETEVPYSAALPDEQGKGFGENEDTVVPYRATADHQSTTAPSTTHCSNDCTAPSDHSIRSDSPNHPDSIDEDSLSEYDNVGSDEDDEEQDYDEDEELHTDADGMTYYVHCCPEDESYMEGMDCHEGADGSDGPSTSQDHDKSCKQVEGWVNSEGFYEVLQKDTETLVYKRPEPITDPTYVQAPMAEDEDEDDDEEDEDDEEEGFLPYDREEAEEDQDEVLCRNDCDFSEDSTKLQQRPKESYGQVAHVAETDSSIRESQISLQGSMRHNINSSCSGQRNEKEGPRADVICFSKDCDVGETKGDSRRRIRSKTHQIEDTYGDRHCKENCGDIAKHADSADKGCNRERHSFRGHGKEERGEEKSESVGSDVPKERRERGPVCTRTGPRVAKQSVRERLNSSDTDQEVTQIMNGVKVRLNMACAITGKDKGQSHDQRKTSDRSKPSSHRPHRRESQPRPPNTSPVEQPDTPLCRDQQEHTKEEKQKSQQEQAQIDQNSPEQSRTSRVSGPEGPTRSHSSPQQTKRNPSFPSFVDVPGPCDPEDLIDGIIFAASYLGSTQLLSERNPSKSVRMIQAQEAVDRVKCADGETQSVTDVDLFISTKAIKVLNADTQETMMDNALRTISYIADIGSVVVLMARRRMSHSASLDCTETAVNATENQRQYQMVCYVFESEDAQIIAQSIGQAFSMAYQEFLRANGINPKDLSQKDYSDILNTQEMYNDDLVHFSNSENCKELQLEKQKGEILGVVIVESGWGSILPTVILACMLNTGAAARSGKLSVGDQIMAVNDTSLVGLPLATCQGIIKALKNQVQVKLSVVSCPPVTTVLIKRPDLQYQLGFSVQNGIICSLMRGGIAERGGVRVGHRIIEINGQSVVAMAHERIVHALSMSVGEINMKTMPAVMFRLLTGQETPVYI
ncbi:amyloid-beta A4 precursor protein-binding family A member 2 [Chanos chanos]|uniref:Amyloid-beta A4 precursor protein-binding family A member 3 n=1 Tax=Chanos chanos TaxID=29144 RepID=A0A6J2UME0_CHACN|nr:amyloid-beta A4 precursor protein-binding family A member 2-like [Chanos chanos]